MEGIYMLYRKASFGEFALANPLRLKSMGLELAFIGTQRENEGFQTLFGKFRLASVTKRHLNLQACESLFWYILCIYISSDYMVKCKALLMSS